MFNFFQITFISPFKTEKSLFRDLNVPEILVAKGEQTILNHLYLSKSSCIRRLILDFQSFTIIPPDFRIIFFHKHIYV